MGRRLLYITNGIAGAGGLERVLSVRTRLLAEKYGDEIHVLTLNEEGREPFYDFFPGIRLHDVRMQGGPAARLTAWARGIREAVRKVSPDVIAVCDDGFKGFWIPFLVKGFRCPVVYERHVSRLIQAEGKKFPVLMGVEFAAMRLLGGMFPRFVVLTPGNRGEWPMDNVEVIPNPLPFYPDVPSSGQERRVIAVGKISPQKNYGALLRAWKEVHGKFPDWKLDLFGAEKDGGELRKEIRAAGLEGSFLLHPPTREIMREYLASSICAMSSRYEGFGMMLAEAMACGVPCVAFDCPCGPGDIIRHGEDGLLAEAGNVPELASALERLMGDDALRASMAAKARENVKRYAAETVAARWDALFTRVLEEKKGGRS
ncbi:glycosyltransferase family 4 protein [Akkermansia muciniphila]|uniref:glycosyltransferase family 4 protein n=1 Tax=Akkermansia muciniphila TaxID=239935 RepID=UPI001BFF89E9|nr:glycosyltransferase family 4 protein [Akkermansia muciniphila]MBT8778620.1 glycosyltransferase family 4 protein [Akkermansia muciniphila]